MTIDFPWAVDARGRTASVDVDGHVRDLIVQVLLTTPGERVMRPDFGAGLMAAVFDAGGPAAAASAQYLVATALERELSAVIALESVTVDADDAALVATVVYTVRRNGVKSVAVVTAPGSAP
jgi:phage baseplate assembly protein W